MEAHTDNPVSDEPLVLGADDSFLPPVGRTHYGPREGYLKHYQQMRRMRFVVAKRDINTRELTELSTHGQSRVAVAAFNQSRLRDATPHDAIVLLEWVSGGWRLTARAHAPRAQCRRRRWPRAGVGPTRRRHRCRPTVATTNMGTFDARRRQRPLLLPRHIRWRTLPHQG